VCYIILAVTCHLILLQFRPTHAGNAFCLAAFWGNLSTLISKNRCVPSRRNHATSEQHDPNVYFDMWKQLDLVASLISYLFSLTKQLGSVQYSRAVRNVEFNGNSTVLNDQLINIVIMVAQVGDCHMVCCTTFAISNVTSILVRPHLSTPTQNRRKSTPKAVGEQRTPFWGYVSLCDKLWLRYLHLFYLDFCILRLLQNKNVCTSLHVYFIQNTISTTLARLYRYMKHYFILRHPFQYFCVLHTVST
jgi:hypothetical protein